MHQQLHRKILHSASDEWELGFVDWEDLCADITMYQVTSLNSIIGTSTLKGKV